MKKTLKQIKGKKALVFGLGILGGGVATTNWLLDQGARVCVTDLKKAEELASSVKRIEEHLKRKSADGKSYEEAKARLSWALGGHSDALIDAADVVVVNPDVSAVNPFVVRARKHDKRVCNEGTLFYDVWKKPAVGVTGTRGKTTTASWTNHLIGTSVLTGNSTVKPFLAALAETRRFTHAVTELSSFILELFEHATRGPHIAVITNLYRDHLNRHGSMEKYAQAKANIFRYQTARDHLILNHEDEWTPWFINQKPQGQVWRFSTTPLPDGLEGIWHADGALWERKNNKELRVLSLGDFASQWGMHNVANLAAAALAAHLAGVPWARIQSRITSVPVVQYRQEVVHRDAQLTVVNDTTATSPEGGSAAIERWGGPTCILIAGGTDRDLDYHGWAGVVKRHIRRTNLILLDGSATLKMRASLGSWAQGIRSYASLEDAFDVAQKRSRLFVSSLILFSPSAKSFGMFDNEFDRGQQFNAIIKKCTNPSTKRLK